mgnify:CR=1 FL=1
MLKQAFDFKNESAYLFDTLKDLSENDLNTKTQFKEWTFNTIIRHLHVWNYASKIALSKNTEWENFSNELKCNFNEGKSLNDFEKNFTNNLKGKELLEKWRSLYLEITEKFKVEDPKKRVKWVGPDMSVISSISARHMETWAHGQAIFDALGLTRKNKDRIINIVIIGKNTFNWSFAVNNLKIPKEIPNLKLISPSGKSWEFNDENNSNYIQGLAEEFCQVVTQVRNIKDVNLKVHGPISSKWMSIAQCFAGKAQNPPKAGLRKIN